MSTDPTPPVDARTHAVRTLAAFLVRHGRGGTRPGGPADDTRRDPGAAHADDTRREAA